MSSVNADQILSAIRAELDHLRVDVHFTDCALKSVVSVGDVVRSQRRAAVAA